MNEITEAEQILNDLVEKRVAHESRGTQLTDERRKLSFAAATGNEGARKKLATLNEQTVLHQVELENLTAAIDEATQRVQAVRHDEDRRAASLKAKSLREELLPALTDHCQQMDAALAMFVAHVKDATEIVRKLNVAGAGPAERQFLLAGVSCIHAAMWRTPWAREFPAIPPGQRRVFRDLLNDSWAVNVRRRADELDGATPRKAA